MTNQMSKHLQCIEIPTATVVMAAFNVAEYIDDALSSVRNQSLKAIEIVVVDDGSTDATPDILARHAQEDHRIRVLRTKGVGPAGARNFAFAHARGRWISIVDADDVVLPNRLARMIDAGEKFGVDAVADNLTAFYEGSTIADHAWIDPAYWSSERLLTFEDLMKGGLGAPPSPELGYLKPVLRRERLTDFAPPYREDLLIGEDFDLMARWLAAGRTYLYLPAAGYRYRRRTSSISYRLTPGQIEQMVGALNDLDRDAPGFDGACVDRRKANLENMLRYARRVARLKRRDLSALAPLVTDQDYRRRFGASVLEGVSRRLQRRTSPSGLDR